MKDPLGGESLMPPYIPFFGLEGIEQFTYVQDDGKLELIMGNVIHVIVAALLLRNVSRCLNQLAIPVALELQTVSDQEHVIMPLLQYLSVRSFLDEKLSLIIASDSTLSGLRLRFYKPNVVLQISVKHWVMDSKAGPDRSVLRMLLRVCGSLTQVLLS